MRALVVLALSLGCVGGLKASSVLCMAGGGGGSLASTTCGQTFTASDFLNWGAPVGSGGLGEAVDPGATNLGSVVTVTSPLDVGIDVTSNMTLERADNTYFAWIDTGTNSWEVPPNINTFDGQFNAPSTPSLTPPYGPNNYPYQYGDPLLGAVGNDYSSTPEMTLSFSSPLYGVAFEVSSKNNPNFIATLTAYGPSGGELGVYQINTNGTGLGGYCPGLLDPYSGGNPVPCNDAPTIQFYDPEGRIASVVLTVNDPTGFFIDELGLDENDTSTPEPGSAALIGVGLIGLALVAKRASRVRKAKQDIPAI
jgi:hypothetical protein